MPLTRHAADAFGAVTICLVGLFVLLGLFCVLYLLCFRFRIRREGYLQLGYFNGPWIVRIALVVFSIWWALGEILRLSLLKGKGRLLHSLSLKWQENLCKVYILSNLGFAEPSLFLTLVFLLQASLQRRDFGTLGRRWNRKTVACVLLLSLPVFISQLVFIIGPKFNNGKTDEEKGFAEDMPNYFASDFKDEKYSNTAFCTYPLLSTILLGLFASLLIGYFIYVGARMVSLVINKSLQRRIYWLVFSVVGLLPMRIMFLGFSVLASPGDWAFEALTFLAFLGLLFCAALGIGILVYLPVADSLAVRGRRLETSMTGGGSFATTVSIVVSDIDDDNSSLIAANQSLLEGTSTTSAGRNSDLSVKDGSISFRTMLKDAPAEAFEEISLFSCSSHRPLASAPGSPPLPGRPMIPLQEFSKFSTPNASK